MTNPYSETQQLGKYRVDTLLGQGAMGVVYKGFDADIDRAVALKVLHGHLLEKDDDGRLASRFKQEAKAAARCMHANIVTIFDFGFGNGRPYIVMEYVEGIDLKALVREQGKLPFRQAADIVFQVLNALEYAHDHGVVHRDIKPANILILDNGQVKVADFGVARLDNSDLTQAGYLVGTPHYMSPEGRRGEVVDARSDLFSVGVVFHELLCGKRLGQEPISRRGLEQDIRTAIGEPALATPICRVLSTVLSRQPEQRYQCASEFANRLGGILSPDQRHVPDTDNLAETVLRTAAREKPPAAGHSPAAAVHFPSSIIQQVSQALLSHIGPMASQLVKKHAKNAASIEQLLDSLSAYIPDPSEQTQFKTSLQHTSLSQPGVPLPGAESSHRHSPAAAPGSGGASKLALSAATLGEICSLLTRYVGPVASRLANRSLSRASDRADFVRRLAASIPNDHDRQQFAAALKQILRTFEGR